MSGASSAAASPHSRRPPPEAPVSGVVSVDDLAEIEDSLASIQHKPSTGEFSWLVNEISLHRRKSASNAQLHKRSCQSLVSSNGDRSHSRMSSVDDESVLSAVAVRPCCCGQPECETGRRVALQLRDMESDLQLSAEIGQALLQRQDAIVHRSQQEAEEHALQRDQLLARLSQSIRENQALERKVAQLTFNLEAADQSHHALLAELESVRHQLKKAKMQRTKSAGLDAKLLRATNELEDARAELAAERRRYSASEARAKQLLARQCSELRARVNEERERVSEERERADAERARSDKAATAWDAVQALIASDRASEDERVSQETLRVLSGEHEALRSENEQLRALFDAANDEISELRELAECVPVPRQESLAADLGDVLVPGTPHPDSPFACVGAVPEDGLDSSRSDVPPRSDETHETRTAITTPSTSSRAFFDDAASWDTNSLRGTMGSEADGSFETRTAMLSSLVDYASRTLAKLSAADIDTLTGRLQRQKLAGDVAHLSRTTVQASVRDVEGLREHFRRVLDREVRQGTAPADGSLVTRRDFFAVLKLMREALLEIARLRRCINEVHLSPNQAARLLHEHLGANTAKASWFTRMFTGVLGDGASSSAVPTVPAAAPSHEQAPSESGFVGLMGVPTVRAQPVPERRRGAGAPPSRVVSRASPAVMSTSVAVHVRGSQTAAAMARGPSALKPKASQPSLAAASRVAESRPPALRDAAPEVRPMRRARGLSDSSIHSTFLEHDEAVDRVITPATLTLEADA